MKFAQDIIIAPVITEKSMDMIGSKKYVFKVDSKATKPQIAKACEELFGVKVACVHTISMKSKPKRLRYSEGYTASWKKAIVTLKSDSKAIEFFEGLN